MNPRQEAEALFAEWMKAREEERQMINQVADAKSILLSGVLQKRMKFGTPLEAFSVHEEKGFFGWDRVLFSGEAPNCSWVWDRATSRAKEELLLALLRAAGLRIKGEGENPLQQMCDALNEAEAAMKAEKIFGLEASEKKVVDAFILRLREQEKTTARMRESRRKLRILLKALFSPHNKGNVIVQMGTAQILLTVTGEINVIWEDVPILHVPTSPLKNG